MLTKVGRRQPMLICCDCGQPAKQGASSSERQHRIRGALFMVALAAVAAIALFLSHINDRAGEGLLPAEKSEQPQQE